MANKNTTLANAKAAARDEFYTRYEDIAAELSHYASQFKGKRIICPCDWDESLDEICVYASEEYVQGSDLFSGGTVKVIDTDKTDTGTVMRDIRSIKCQFVKFLIAHAEAYGIASISVSGYNPMTCEGVKFQDLDYSKYDLCVTNPPFSQFREFLATIQRYPHLEFLVIGNQNAISYQEIFPLIKNNKMWLGYGFKRNCAHFINPYYEDTASDADHREGMIRVSGVMWFTNLDVSLRHDEMILVEEYDPEKYPKYDNFDAIEVSKAKDIPYDYEGLMGVPLTWLTKYNPDQFEILGIMASTQITDTNFGYPYIDGQRKYARIIIRNRKPVKRNEE